ncbi:MAG: DUF927 domain-containing protein, partial [Thermodesulfobacteriota bacterium]
STGKTTVLELASSIWGNPHKESGGLIFSWDSTRVFLERMANFFCDIPIFPDDSQTVDDRTMKSMLYQIANGVGKGRGSVTGIRHTPTWHTICFSTGEKPLVECTTFSGARARTIEIYGSPFPNAKADFINDLKQGVRENYGHAGQRYIEGILPLLDNPDEMTREYRRYQRVLSMKSGSEVGDRYSHYFSVVKLAADNVYRILGIGDPAEAEGCIHRVFSNLVSDYVCDVDISKRAMEYVLSWISGNEVFFKEGGNTEKYGLWSEGEYIGILPHKLKEVLNREGYSDKIVLKGWADKGWIKRDKGHFTYLMSTIEEGKYKQKRAIVIPWSVVEEFLE